MSAGQVYQIVGPPGTGKTTALARHAARAVEARGPSAVVALSLTRTAAAEIAGRDSGIEPKNIGTLHGLLFRALEGRALVLDSSKGIRAWNEWIAAKGSPEWSV